MGISILVRWHLLIETIFDVFMVPWHQQTNVDKYLTGVNNNKYNKHYLHSVHSYNICVIYFCLSLVIKLFQHQLWCYDISGSFLWHVMVAFGMFLSCVWTFLFSVWYTHCILMLLMDKGRKCSWFLVSGSMCWWSFLLKDDILGVYENMENMSDNLARVPWNFTCIWLCFHNNITFTDIWSLHINSLVTGRFGWDFKMQFSVLFYRLVSSNILWWCPHAMGHWFS